MDKERAKKMESGREKLEMYKKKRAKKNKGDGTSSSSDSSVSLTPPSLPMEKSDHHSDSSISEHVVSSSGASVENDRSLQEMFITNIPTSNFSLLLHSEDEIDHISQEIKPPSFNSSYRSDSITNSDVINVKNNVQSILEEILRNEQFISDSEHTVHRSSSFNSRDDSLNIFEHVQLDDNSINNYALRKQQHSDNFMSTNDVPKQQFLLLDSMVGDSSKKVKDLEELLTTKDTTIAVLTAELDSFRDLASNPSTLSLGTTTTEYKQFQEEYHNRIVDFQNAVAHRDNLIQQLTDSLQQSLINREELQQQSEFFAKEIAELQKQLAKTSALINQHRYSQDETDILKIDDEKLSVDMTTKVEEVKTCDNKELSAITGTVLNLEGECSKFQENLNLTQLTLFNDLKININSYIQQKINEHRNAQANELKILKDKMENEKEEHGIEVARLRELLAGVKCGSAEIMELRQELDTKHAREMEELRRYFEQKCVDMEKHYSEEIFSQQSRKMSGSSTTSDQELASDLLYSGSHHQPGPGGDSGSVSLDYNKIDPNKHDLSNLTANDLIKLKQDLGNIFKDLEQYDLNSMTKEDVTLLCNQLSKYDLRSLARYDLLNLKAEIQNKYHAELEILREDYENKIDMLNVENENKLQSIERKYVDKIELLKFDLDEALRSSQINVSSAIQEVASSGEFEISEVVQSYERRLQEQVTLAKFDIISALECQIQRLAASEGDDEEWPTELLQLRDKFCEKYESQIEEININHQNEIEKLKEEHHKILSGALERARRRSLKENESDVEIIKERDSYKKTNIVLRHLVGELLKYFTQCEDELNNTLVDELLKHGFDKNLTEIEDSLKLEDSLQMDSIKRVHFMPDFTDFMTVIDSSNLTSLESKDLSIDLKNELGSCLDKLKADANAILALTTNIQQNQNASNSKNSTSLDEKVSSLTRQLITETQLKNEVQLELEDAKNLIHNLEKERDNFEGQVEELVTKQKIIETDLLRAKEKIGELIESGRKEVVSEGYGENLVVTGSIGGKMASLTELQEKARTMIAERTSNADSSLLQLVEQLCHEGDHIMEESKRDHDDLKQQVEAADKKYKAICRFLEEQAVEREQERDEALKEISSLRDQLRSREKDRASCERINSEVEQLEKQMREMSKCIEENELKLQESEKERRDAIDKITDLRGIICNLEVQIENKTETETELRYIINELENIIKQQTKSNSELNEQLDSLKSIPDAQHFQEHISLLEGEVQKLRLSTELAGSEGAVKQISTQLAEFEVFIEKQTKELEALHSAISTTSCSSPSEDMSIRDQIRSHTPVSVQEECDAPLQQLARLKDKLIKHSRVEDAAIKRIRDLEMQLVSSKHDFEEVQNERDILQEQVSEQLILISSLQIRLDEQRLLVENAEKQTNTSLEVRIYELECEIQNLRETIHKKDKTIKQLDNTIQQTKIRLEEREQEIQAIKESEDVMNLRNQIEELIEEKRALQNKINLDAQNAQIFPNLVDNIIADKNADIEKLREKLAETEKQLETYNSLNLDCEQLLSLSRMKSTDRALVDVLSLMSEPEQLRRVNNESDNLFSPITRKDVSSIEADLSSIEKVGPSNIHYTIADATLMKPNSTEINKSTEKRVHFQDTKMESLQINILALKNEISQRDEIIEDYVNRLQHLNDVEGNIQKLQENLEITESTLKNATRNFEKEQNDLKEMEKKLRVELAEKKMHLDEKEKQLEEYKKDSERKDQMYINLAKEKRTLELRIKELQENEDFNNVIAEKNKEIYILESQLAELQDASERIENLEMELKQKFVEVEELQQKLNTLEDTLRKRIIDFEDLKTANEKVVDENAKLAKELQNNCVHLNSLNEEIEKLKQQIKDGNQKMEELKHNIYKEENQSDVEGKIKYLQNLLAEREREIEVSYKDAKNYRENIISLEQQIQDLQNQSELELQLIKNRKEIAEKDLNMTKLKQNFDDLTKEHEHLQILLQEKEKVIKQMSEDSKSLHVNLETIQNKMQKTGNIIDLGKRLRDEQKLNSDLLVEIHSLKAKLIFFENLKENEMTTSLEQITGQVRRQLDYSAHLDTNILNAVSGEEEDVEIPEDLENIKQSLTKVCSLNRDLIKQKERLQAQLNNYERELDAAKEKIISIQHALEKEKMNNNEIQLEDAKLIEQMRIRLDSAMDKEEQFEKMLEEEKRMRHDLETQVSTLKQKTAQFNSSSNSKTEATEYMSLPNMALGQLKTDLEKLKQENFQLESNVKSLKRACNEHETNFKYTKDLLALKSKEVEDLESKIQNMKKVDSITKEKMMELKIELEQRTREIENTRVLIEEMEQDRLEVKKQMNQLNEKLKEYKERETHYSEVLGDDRNNSLNAQISDQLLQKIKDLSNLVKDNKQMTDTLAKLADERHMLQERIRELEGQNGAAPLPFDDPVARANHLFSRYLRSESYRKALTWQKRYLIALLATYQDFRPITERLPLSVFSAKINTVVKTRGKSRFRSVVTSIISIIRMQYLVRRWHSGKRIGININSSYFKPKIHTNKTMNTVIPTPAQFHIGQPVSSQHFTTHPFHSKIHSSQHITSQQLPPDNPILSTNHRVSSDPAVRIASGTSNKNRSALNNYEEFRQQLRTPTRNSEDSWSGLTPPGKDKTEIRTTERNSRRAADLSSVATCSERSAALRAPALLSQYVERFNEIQTKLGMALNKPT